MSCFFCKSFNHFSQNCDIFITDESRKNVAISKNCCPNCLIEKFSEKDPRGCCFYNQKCYICFSRNHHSVYCPFRYRTMKYGAPKIDELLMPRFLQILTVEEKMFILFRMPPNVAITMPPLPVKHPDFMLYECERSSDKKMIHMLAIFVGINSCYLFSKRRNQYLCKECYPKKKISAIVLQDGNGQFFARFDQKIGSNPNNIHVCLPKKF